jgi:hypothetical protein
MSLYSKQKFYCNSCGREMFCEASGVMGSKFLGWRVCSEKCVREIRWKETLSIMNKEYYPHPDPNYYNPDYNPDTGKKY